MALHWKVEDAFDEIDAAVFSGDSFHDPDNLETIEYYMSRWNREIVRIRKNLENPEVDDE